MHKGIHLVRLSVVFSIRFSILSDWNFDKMSSSVSSTLIHRTMIDAFEFEGAM